MDHFYESVPGFFHFLEGYRRILSVLPTDRPSSFVEVGSFCGKSLCYFGVEAINRGIPVSLHAVDNFVGWEQVPSGEDLRVGFIHHTRPLRKALDGRFQLWAMPSLEAAEHFAEHSIDAVWIDGDHSYEGCTADIRAWFPKLKTGGFMGGDDFMMRGVSQSVVEQFGANYICGHGESPENPEIHGPWLWWLVKKDDT
jgi:cephalosporin hydroxylase